MTQTERVLAALRRAGARGVTQVEFLLPHVIDGGSPVTRLGARILELREEGHHIVAGERRSKCVVYRLAGVSDGSAPGGTVAVVGGTVGPSETPAGLFDPAIVNRPASPFDPFEDAA